MKWPLAFLVAIYVLAIVSLAIFQRRFMYFPDRRLTHPAEAGMSGVEELRLMTDDGETLVAFTAMAGRWHNVTVVPNGYVWRETTYASLSTIARAITGTAWSGPRFFGLRSGGKPAVSSVVVDVSSAAPNGIGRLESSSVRPSPHNVRGRSQRPINEMWVTLNATVSAATDVQILV